MSENIGGEDSGGQEQWHRCGITGVDTTAEEMRDRNRRDVGRHKWQMSWKNGNGLGKYRQGTTTNLRAYCCSDNLGMRGDDGSARQFRVHLESVCLIL